MDLLLLSTVSSSTDTTIIATFLVLLLDRSRATYAVLSMLC